MTMWWWYQQRVVRLSGWWPPPSARHAMWCGSSRYREVHPSAVQPPSRHVTKRRTAGGIAAALADAVTGCPWSSPMTCTVPVHRIVANAAGPTRGRLRCGCRSRRHGGGWWRRRTPSPATRSVAGRPRCRRWRRCRASRGPGRPGRLRCVALVTWHRAVGRGTYHRGRGAPVRRPGRTVLGVGRGAATTLRRVTVGSSGTGRDLAAVDLGHCGELCGADTTDLGFRFGQEPIEPIMGNPMQDMVFHPSNVPTRCNPNRHSEPRNRPPVRLRCHRETPVPDTAKPARARTCCLPFDATRVAPPDTTKPARAESTGSPSLPPRDPRSELACGCPQPVCAISCPAPWIAGTDHSMLS